MKNNIKVIKKHFILLLGVGLFVYGVFNFFPGVNGYFYEDGSLFLLSFGAIFIVMGLLKIKTRDDGNII
jgi:hypothetical protein